MKGCFTKLQHLFMGVALVALAGCGANNAGTVASVDNASGAVQANLVWGGQNAKSGAHAMVATIPAEVAKVELTVSGTGATGPIPVVKNTVAVSGGSATGSVSGIYPGTVAVAVKALTSAGQVAYEGFALNAVVAAGATTNVGTITMTPPIVKAAEAPCIGCHENALDGTGQNIVANYKQSSHYTNSAFVDGNGVVVGCAGCHGTNHNDGDPAASGKCFSCHGALGAAHLNAASTGVNTPARYLNGTNTNCSACHQPHNPINGTGYQERKDWKASGHGDVTGAAWTHYDFTGSGRGTCAACHTTTGFLRALNSGWTVNTDLSSTSTGKEVLACNGCHSSSNNFKGSVRTIPGGYTAGMGGFGSAAKATISFPDVGESNLCIPCHASRENGVSLQGGSGTPTNFANSTLKNPHYLAAAAVFYGKGGFQFYTSGVRYNTYGAAGKVGKNANWSHGRLGMDNYSASGSNDVIGKSNNTGTKGQCVACHLGPKNTHTFGALETANATMAGTGKTRGCYGCHQGTDMDMASFIDEEKEIWNRLFDFFIWNFQYNADGTQRTTPIYFNPDANPYFFSDSAKTVSMTNWTLSVPGGTGAQTMGAAMNLKLLTAEKGSFAHNRAFGRALIADSIIYLQNGTVGDRAVAAPTQNGVMAFTAYSTARPVTYPGQVGANVSITTLKSYLTKTATGGYVRR